MSVEQVQGQNEMDAKDKADLYCKLREAARQRLESIRGLTWKVNIGLWTILFVGTGFLMSAKVWTPSILHTIVVTVLAVIGAFLQLWWLAFTQRRHEKDNRQSYWWETHVLRIIGDERTLPRQLAPDNLSPEDRKKQPAKCWHSAFDLDHEDPDHWGRNVDIGRLPPVQWFQFGITCLLTLLLIFTAWAKYADGQPHETAFSSKTLAQTLAKFGLSGKVVIKGTCSDAAEHEYQGKAFRFDIDKHLPKDDQN